MKFTDGYWLTRSDVTLHHAHDVVDYRIDPRSFTVFTTTRPLTSNGSTTDNPTITIEFSSPLPDIIAVRACHFDGELERGPHFELSQHDDFPLEIELEGDRIRLTSGQTSVRVRIQGTWTADYDYAGSFLTSSNFRHLSYAITQDGRCYMKDQLDLSVGENVYGLGERFTPYVKNGQIVDIWNEDGGTSSEQAYKNIPFYLTNRNYGVLVNHPEKVSFEVASEVVTRTQFSVPGQRLSYFVIGGDSPKSVLMRYAELSGKPALPPAWSFGLWLTTSFTTEYSEETFNSFINGMKSRRIPLQVFHYDCFWMKELEWCGLEWDTRRFSDPAGMLARIKQDGLKVCLWINPYVAQKSRMFAEGKAKGYFVKKPDGGVWQWDRWQAGMALIDFTNPGAVSWFREKLRALVRIGVDTFKTDFGERIPTDVVYFDGSDPLKMHNYYTYLYNQTVFSLLKEELGEGRACVFARSATVGGQQFPVHWGGDCSANYPSMAETLRGGLSLSQSGFGFWSHDISGFEKTATPDLYKRWSAFGLLSTHSRLHGNESYRVPWLFDEESVAVLRFFVELKCRLMPYLFSAASETARTGVPVMRPMMLEFPADPTCDVLDRQYLLGERLLVAPVFSPDGRVTYYLPAGTWTHLLTGATVTGGRWIQEQFDYFGLPLLVRPNTLLATHAQTQMAEYDFADQAVFQLFALEEGQTSRATVCDIAGKPDIEVVVIRQGTELAIEWTGSGKPWSLVLRNIRTIQSVTGGQLASLDHAGEHFQGLSLDVCLQPVSGSSRMVVQL